MRAAGGAIYGVDQVIQGNYRNAFVCVRSETNPEIQHIPSTEAIVYDEMVQGFWKELMEKECMTIVKKFDVYYDVF